MVLKGSPVLRSDNGLEQLSVPWAGKQGLRVYPQWEFSKDPDGNVDTVISGPLCNLAINDQMRVMIPLLIQTMSVLGSC